MYKVIDLFHEIEYEERFNTVEDVALFAEEIKKDRDSWNSTCRLKVVEA